MMRTTVLLAAAAVLALPVFAAEAPKKATTKQFRLVKAKPSAHAATPAPAVVDEPLTQAQLDIATRVFVGEVACEFDQTVNVTPVDGHPGHFNLAYKKAKYDLVPMETTTGAVRLEDRKAGVVWLQIPAKSMLMNAKIGQRMIDSCQHSEQRNAVAVTDGAIGIETAKR